MRMKRMVVCALLALLLALPGLSLAQSRPVVVDDADLLTASEETQLETQAQAIIDAYQVDVVIVTSTAVPYGQSQKFADDYYDNNGYGVGEDRAGLLFLIDMRNRQEQFSTTGVMIDYITDNRLDALLDAGYDALKRGDYAACVRSVLTQLEVFLRQGRQEGSFRYDVETGVRYTRLYNALTGPELLLAVLCGLAVMGVIVLTVTVRYHLRGSTYHYDASRATCELTQDQEQYIRSTVVRTPRVQASGGGGGGHGGFGGGMGSGTHGGGSHGGGGRGF